MKFRFSLVFVLLLSFFIATNTHANISNFNTYGLKGNASSIKDLPTFEPSKLITLGKHENVELSKTWTINFTKTATANNVQAVAIVYNDQLIPVTISGLKTKQLKVKATYQYPANATLQLRVYLKNGRWYTVDFMTVDKVRDITKPNNSTVEQAIPLYLNETIKTAFHGEEAYYSFTISEQSTLSIPQTPEFEFLGHQVYKKNADGSLEHIEPYEYNQINYAVQLFPGQYVLTVYNSTGDTNYTYPLEVLVEPDNTNTDPNDTSFNDAVSLKLQQPVTTTLNMMQSNRTLDKEDYYKFVVEQDGYVKIFYDVIGYTYADLQLYKANYQLLETNRVSSESPMLLELPKGTYYMKLTNADSAIKYTIEYAALLPIAISNDVATQLAMLKQQWASLKPKYGGVDMIENIRLTPPYELGNVRQEAFVDAINYANMMRFTAGLPMNLTTNDYLNKTAQAASLINFLNDDLSHYPTRPENVSDELYEYGRQGALGNIASNYFYLHKSVQGYMDDLGHSNSLRVGHRLWILKPELSEVGFGFAGGIEVLETMPYRNFSYSTMTLATDSYNTSNFEPIAWPAKTVMPLQFAHKDASWSITFNAKKYELDLDDLQVTLTKNGESQLLNAQNTEYFTISGFNASTLVFKPNEREDYKEGDHFEVEVTGLKDQEGKSTTYKYVTTFLSIE